MRKVIITTALLLVAATFAQVRDNGSRVIEGTINHCSDAGASDAYACNLSPAITAYIDNACYQFEAATANTGSATINLNSLGAKTIKKVAGGVTTDLSDNDIRAGQIVRVCYDGVNMQMQSQLGNAGGGSGTVTSVTGTANEITVANGTTTPGLSIAATVDFSGKTSTKTVKTGTAAPGTCGVGELFFDTDATAGSNFFACTSTNTWTLQGGGGGSSSYNSTANMDMIWPNTYGGGGFQVTGAAHQATMHRVALRQGLVSAGIGFEVTTASGTCGGTCGFIFGLYDASNNLIALTEVGTSGNGTDSKNINTTGIKRLVWSSGSAVSGGTLTVAAGKYYLSYSTDSTAIQLRGNGSAYWMVVENGLEANSHGGQSSFSSGSGASITLPSTKSGTWTAGWADWTPIMFWF